MSDSTSETTISNKLSADELMRASRLVEHIRADRFTLGSPEQNAYGIQLLEHSDDEVVRAALALIPHFTTSTPKGEAWMKRLHDSKSESVEDSSESEMEFQVSTPEVVLEVVPAEKSNSEEAELRQLSKLTWETQNDLRILAEGIRQQAEARQAKVDEINAIRSQNGTGKYTDKLRRLMGSENTKRQARFHRFICDEKSLWDAPLDALLKDLRILDSQLKAEQEASKAAREAEAADRRKAKATEEKTEPVPQTLIIGVSEEEARRLKANRPNAQPTHPTRVSDRHRDNKSQGGKAKGGKPSGK